MSRHLIRSSGAIRLRPATGRVIEGLERRLLLSSVAWTGSGDGTSWTDPNNWTSAPTLPAAGDDVTIPAAAGTIHLASGTQSIHSLTSGEAVSFDGGTLNVGATAQFTVPATLHGGTLSGGTWTFTGAGSQLNATPASGTLNALTLNGTLDLSQQAGDGVTVLGGLVLNGTMLLGNDSGSTYGQVLFGYGAAAGSLTGSGSVVFGASAYNTVYNYSSATGAAGLLTIGPGITVHGKNGQIREASPTASLSNQGTISADVSAGTITVNSGAFTNAGTLSAINGGTLDLLGPWSNSAALTVNGGTLNLGGSFTQAGLGTFSRTGGTVNLTGTVTGGLSLDASTGSWNLANGTVSGGALDESGGATLVFGSMGGTLDGVTANGTLDLSQLAGVHLAVLGGLVLNGTMLLGNDSGSTYGQVLFGYGAAAGSLTGSGSVVFGASAYNTVYNYSSATGAAGLLTIGPGITVHGKNGQIREASPTASLSNQGTISADVSAGTITVNSGAFTNAGTLSAINGGTLDLLGPWSNSAALTVNGGTLNLGGSFTQAGLGTFSRTGGTVNLTGTVTGGLSLDASTGSWNLANGTVSGGALDESGGATLVFGSMGGTLDGVTANGTLDLSQLAGVHLAVLGGLVLNGTMLLGNDSGSTYGQVVFGYGAAAGSLTGSGSVVFGASAYNVVYNYSSATGAAGALTIGPGITIHGKSGQITNASQTASLSNQGTISADVAGGTITVNCGPLTNTGTLSAINGGTLTVQGLAGNVNTVAVSGTGSSLALGGANYTLNLPLTVTAGQTLSLNGSPWANSSTLTLNGGTLNLGGSFTQAGLGTFSRTGGTVNLTGTITGGLPLDTSTGSWNLANGTVSGGTIEESGGATLVFGSLGGTLDGVTANATLDLSQLANAHVTVLGGLVLNGTMLLGNDSGSTYGQVLFGYGAAAGSLTGSGSVVFGASAYNVLYNYSNATGAAGALTIGPGITIHGKSGQITDASQTASLSNQGTISADVAGGTINVNCGPLTNTGTLSAVNGGILALGNTVTDSGTMTFQAGGQLTGAASLIVNSVPVTFSNNPAPVTNSVASLTLNGSAVLNLGNNVLHVNYGMNADPFQTIQSYAHAASIVVSSSNPNYGLGFGDTAVAPIPGADHAVVLRWARRGDVNLDGTVAFADLLLLAQNYGQHPGGNSWQQGDFNNDGSVNFADLLALAQNYGQSAAAAVFAASIPGSGSNAGTRLTVHPRHRA